MTGFEAPDSIQPQKSMRYRLKNTKSKGYTWAVVLMFLLVLMLCVNNYLLLDSYNSVSNELKHAYGIIDDEKSAKKRMADDDAELKDEYRKLSEELGKLKESYNKASRGSDDLSQQLDKLKKQNVELVKQLKDMTNDNIALQNSLKMAASVGVKPQSYSMFDGLEPRDAMNRGRYIGKFLGTAYTPSKEECGNDKGITKSGEPIMPGVTVAVDNRFWPFGTVFYIKGLGYTIAMDTGSAIKGKYRFDFSVLDRKFAMELGSRKWDVYLVKMGKGSIGEIKL